MNFLNLAAFEEVKALKHLAQATVPRWEGCVNVGPALSSPTPGDLLCDLPFWKELVVLDQVT